MPTATPETIRNRVAALIEALTPTSDSRSTFRQSRDEAAADFPTWAESAPTACLRRFQVRNRTLPMQPLVSNHDAVKVRGTFEVRIAYPNSHRYGGGRDRDDVIWEDLAEIMFLIGAHGRANFSGTNDCTPLGTDEDPVIERGDKVSMLVILPRYEWTQLANP